VLLYLKSVVSNIEAVGIDLADVPRIKKAIEHYGDRFLSRVFTPWEIQYCLAKINPELSFAARFAVKEAVFKAIGTGFAEGVKWTSVEVVNDKRGQPQVRLGQAIRRHIGSKEIMVSLSHTKEYAMACAILVSEPGASGA
jgi:holo-[acyl-carrier protein] synthase